MANDLVPCFYAGQNYRVAPPAELLPRDEVRHYKKLKLGKFVDSGKFFLFFQQMKKVLVSALWDGPFGIGNVLSFYRIQNKLRAPDSINYPIPCVGAHTRLLTVAKVNYVPEFAS